MSVLEHSDLERHLIRALHEILAGREPDNADTSVLTGDGKECIDALQDTLRLNGVKGVRQVFMALVKDRPWLGGLATQPVPALNECERADEQKHVRRIRFRSETEYESRPSREWLIPSILPKAGIAMVFGPPGCGKSFLTMDWSLSIASGTEWLGHPVQHGPVAYIVGEGAAGLGSRTKAWKQHHCFTGDSGVRWFDEAIALQDASTIEEAITAFKEDFTKPPVLVVIDTLSRCSGGADENSNSEMAKVIAAADRIQQQFGCTVLIVHHTGKDKDKGPRGASALIGNTETIIEVAPTDEGCKVICFKQKDASKFDPINLKLQLVQYGPEQDDNSAVLIMGSEKMPMDADEPTMSRSELVMYAALQDKALFYSEWVQAGIETGEANNISRSSAEMAIRKLVRSGKVLKKGKIYHYASDDDALSDDYEQFA